MASASRLTTAIDDGLLTLPDGSIAVMRPSAQFDISRLPREQVVISHTFRPDFVAWEHAGYPVAQAAASCDLAIVVVPRSKTLAQAMIAAAAQKAPRVAVDGYKTDGIDSLFKACRKRLGDLPSVAKDHGRLFWMEPEDHFLDWLAPKPARGPEGFFTSSGVFSEGSVDKGSALLAASLPAKLPARMADFGAGWGYLTDAILKRDGVKTVDLIEAEALSLECAKLNITDSRAVFHWADATTFIADKGFDGVVMNPPFHTGRAADPALGRAFIQAARRLLAPHGKLWMVANRHLPYESSLKESFRNVDELAGNGAFKVFHATRPFR
ncbi:16S rRNA m(2)G 1207 methyltransferase [Cognatiyoonia koreensis]|uniref:16S rRNA m(2)G 1207 methyltransferase n=1 Tax=Cognatiyoonia koreensis TaxID=364200 RepID=A0A1I0RBM9_9RHOB|nr:methyltransferase [Cognatiyoonia koreensis]SEW38119.1 16S rRNA m(2)G 1207 methyltransferase [Cognatiyoonia koreensis]